MRVDENTSEVDPYELDEGTNDYDDESAGFLPYTGGFTRYGWNWPNWGGRGLIAGFGAGEENDAYAEGDADEDDGWWDEALISILLVAGVVLFLFPEPITSTVGVILIVVGLGAWIADALA
ncbi:MAG: hypothetical protein ABEJ28_06455 [Salinigranum sp.]